MYMNLSKYFFISLSFIFIGCSLEQENAKSLGEVKHIYIAKKETIYDSKNLFGKELKLIDNALELSQCKRENKNICNYVVIGLGDRSKIIHRANCLFCDTESYDKPHYDNITKLIDVSKKSQTVELIIGDFGDIIKNKFELSLERIDSEADRELLINVFK
ncbi:hypothetical protein [Fluviispira vulneris]|uniref:hypothetical protein n=1 Tax=Fluviispira vulneris TaxID=2763012 RepID=UPI001648BE6B|nr:hypothetical protein [Fluviispira vulneris]